MIEKIPVLCSTGTFLGRVNNCDYRLVEKICSSLDCEGFELMMFERWRTGGDYQNILACFKQSGLRFLTVHAEKNIGGLISSGDTEEAYEIFKTNCRTAVMMNAGIIVIHLWGYPGSDENFTQNMSAYKILREISDYYGLILAVENIPCTKSDPLSRHIELRERYPDIKFTFDTRMAAFHKQLESVYSDTNYWKSVAHVHFSSFSGELCQWERLSKILHPGEGEVNISLLFSHLYKNGYKGAVTLESPVMSENGEDVEKLKRSLCILNETAEAIRNGGGYLQ